MAISARLLPLTLILLLVMLVYGDQADVYVKSWRSQTVCKDGPSNCRDLKSVWGCIPVVNKYCPKTCGLCTESCGEVYTASKGVIRHPLSGRKYEDNEDCVWKINAAEPIKITFVTFDLETNYDFLYVRNGPSSDSPLLGRFSGFSIPNSVETTQNSAYLLFSSDTSQTRTGFELRWEPTSTGSSDCDTTYQCGVTNANRIIGGTEVNPKHKYPWQVGFYYPGYWIFCGGTIIKNRWILTAAHCIVDDDTCELKYDPSSGLQVWVGEHNQFDGSDDISDTKKYNIKTFIVHDKYRCDTVDYDFALLELTEAIPFNSVIRPICLPEDDTNTYAGRTGIVTGWGRTNNNGKQMSKFLRVVEVPIIAKNNCGNWGTLPQWKMCTSGGSNKSPCGGDSGGPMSVIENGKHVQVGVVSYGSSAGCASPNWPGVYARVSYVLPWIAENTC